MPTRLRLARFGCKNRPFYRIVATDSRVWRDGQPIEYVSRRRSSSRLRSTLLAGRNVRPHSHEAGWIQRGAPQGGPRQVLAERWSPAFGHGGKALVAGRPRASSPHRLYDQAAPSQGEKVVLYGHSWRRSCSVSPRGETAFGHVWARRSLHDFEPLVCCFSPLGRPHVPFRTACVTQLGGYNSSANFTRSSRPHRASLTSRTISRYPVGPSAP
jgi:ribosomal protein S16